MYILLLACFAALLVGLFFYGREVLRLQNKNSKTVLPESDEMSVQKNTKCARNNLLFVAYWKVFVVIAVLIVFCFAMYCVFPNVHLNEFVPENKKQELYITKIENDGGRICFKLSNEQTLVLETSEDTETILSEDNNSIVIRVGDKVQEFEVSADDDNY